MSLDLTGITNDNEFFSHYYLSEKLEGDLKDVFAAWKSREAEHGTKPPDKQLGALDKRYLDLRHRAERLRKPADLLALQRELLPHVLHALGYGWRPEIIVLENQLGLPVACALRRPDGTPLLWVVETVAPLGDDTDPLTLTLSETQFPPLTEAERGYDLPDDSALEDIVSAAVFPQTEPPRWILAVSFSAIVLVDRTKWAERRVLRFDLAEILGRREPSTLAAVAALLHREALCPDTGRALLDALDEASHRHEYEVSDDLKYSAREAVEILGNEAIWYLREVAKDKVYGVLDPAELSRECLRYLYRLLFMFYVEARPELGYASLLSDEYRKGYSLESLRDLELIPLASDEAKNGHFIHHSLATLFRLVWTGANHGETQREMTVRDSAGGALLETKHHHTFVLAPLKSHLFDPDGTPTLNRVRFRNQALQRVLELLSLSRPNARRRRGRISYSKLGINQLGAVYEGLLSYTGFFAETDLYEVQPAEKKTRRASEAEDDSDSDEAEDSDTADDSGDESETAESDTSDTTGSGRLSSRAAAKKHDDLKQAYFVTEEELPNYTDAERVYDVDGRLRKHPKGRFIYRLAGRNREKSASYYTPESLTRCLVKYALKELLQDKSADEILQTTVCEMALGSGAFLNEAINQLADAYLQKKSQELDKPVPQADYAKEKQRVKMHIADHHCYGVDMNPVAVELAEISLWLNTIHDGAYVPWFGLQLECGNSLIGARRDVFPVSALVRRERTAKLWTDLVPVVWPITSDAPPAAAAFDMPDAKADATAPVFHFLLPDSGMANYADKVVKQLEKPRLDVISAWRRGFCKPFSEGDARVLARLTQTADKLWRRHAEQQAKIRERTSDYLQLWGQPPPPAGRQRLTTADKDKILFQELFSRDVRASSPFRRLKLVLDYWCALWFWPIEHADLLPTRDVWLMDLSLLLEGNVYDPLAATGDQTELKFDYPETAVREEQLKLVDELGFVNVDRLIAENPRLGLVANLAKLHRFHHWELAFADLFARRGGFDLLVGNPPWVLVEWNESGLLSDYDASIAIKKLTAADVARVRDSHLADPPRRAAYLSEYVESAASQSFLGAPQNYPLLQGSKANLYKCFLPVAWRIGSGAGIAGFLHPEGVYDDPKGGALREAAYPRLRYHLQFQNEHRLFADVHNETIFSVNIYDAPREKVAFRHLSNLFATSTLDECFSHLGQGEVGGIKDDRNRWNLSGHRDRIVEVGEHELALFARLYDVDGTPSLQARLPTLHSRQLVPVLERFAACPRRLGDLGEATTSTQHWNETTSQRDGTIRRDTRFPTGTSEWVLSGPHFYVGNPHHQTPRAICNTNRSYDRIDLEFLPDDYLPRTNYVPACSPEDYRLRTPTVPWSTGTRVTEFFRLVTRRGLSQAGERTLIPSLIPPLVGHIDGAFSVAVQDTLTLLAATASCMALPTDFFIKSTGKGDIRGNLAELLPLAASDPRNASRTLVLNCLTSHYADLWSGTWDEAFSDQRWLKHDLHDRLDDSFWHALGPTWTRASALRTDYARRQALVEIDVLVARALRLTLAELRLIFRIQFPVLRQNEADTWYDTRGRIVFTCSKGLPGAGLTRPQFEKATLRQLADAGLRVDPAGHDFTNVKFMPAGTVTRTVRDDTLPTGPVTREITYHAPFDRCDREADYAEVWQALDAAPAHQP